MSEPTPWHRLFALSWIDFFHGTNVEVRMEVDLSLKQQFVDLILIRKGAEPIGRRLPDGLENLSVHNLLTFKSFHEALDSWALMELVGHFVNYRKQSSPSLRELLPERDFRLFAVCARFPQNLVEQRLLTKIRDGVYDAYVLGSTIRVIVAHELPQEEHNAMLHLFSARAELVSYGQEHYRPRSSEISTLFFMLFTAYFEESEMTDEVKEIVRQTLDQLLRGLPREMLRNQLSPEERLEGLPAEERLKGLPAEERLKGLSTDELIRALPPEALETLARRLKSNGSSSS